MTAVYSDISSLPDAAKGCVVAIGNFDGVHLGHRALIAEAAAVASRLGVPLGVVTFEPHPRQFFQPAGAPFRLTLQPMKCRLMRELGVDHLFAIPFDQALSSLTAQRFIDEILVGALRAAHVVIGPCFAFGHKRAGTAQTLQGSGAFGVSVVKQLANGAGEIYSSTAARAQLQAGRFDAAAAILGWRWEMEAPIVHGNKLGRTLGMPTANQNVPDYLRIPYGVYAVRALLEGETRWRAGAANFGIRPMFEIKEPLLETFIFDFQDEIYGKTLRVQPVQHLRAEMSFNGLDALVAQMKEDCLKAAAVLKSSEVSKS